MKNRVFQVQDFEEVVQLPMGSLIDFCTLGGGSFSLVGGIVRDALFLGEAQELTDFDCAVEVSIASLVDFLEEEWGGEVSHFPRYHTASWSYQKKMWDFAHLRREFYSGTGQIERLEKTKSRGEDAHRRDFTINALYALADSKGDFSLYDPTTGLSDLKQKLLRIFHDRSFFEDPTRIVRGVRLQKRLGLSWEAKTLKKREEAIEKGYASDIEVRRWLKEFLVVCHEKEPFEVFRELERIGFLKSLAGCDLGCLDLAKELFQPAEGFLEAFELWLTRSDRYLGSRSVWVDRCRKILREGELSLAVRHHQVLQWEKRRVALLAWLDSGWLAYYRRRFEGPFWVEARDLLAEGLTPGERLGKILFDAQVGVLEGMITDLGELRAWLTR